MRMRKRTVDKVIEDAFWEGFQGGLVDHRPGLEYASDSGLYSYNDVRRIAVDAGYQFAQDVIEKAIARRASDSARRSLSDVLWKYKIPGAVYAECYGEAKIARGVAA